MTETPETDKFWRPDSVNFMCSVVSFQKTMWLYILTVLLSVCVWKLVSWLFSYLRWYKDVCECLSHFPLTVDHHWFYGVVHLIKDGKSYFELMQKTAVKLKPKAVA